MRQVYRCTPNTDQKSSLGAFSTGKLKRKWGRPRVVTNFLDRSWKKKFEWPQGYFFNNPTSIFALTIHSTFKPHGPHCSPEKPVYLRKAIIISLHLLKTWIPFTNGCFVPRLVEIGPVVICWFFNFVSACLLFVIILEKGVSLYLNNHESPSLKYALCQVQFRFG